VGKRAEEGRKVNFKDAIVIGLAQAMAVMPGISRSGSTIATGLLLGVDKNRIARFSFLMVLLPIIGIAILDLKDYFEQISAGNSAVDNDTSLLLAGFIGAFLAGWAACTWMINIVKRGKLIYFAIYCAIVGAIAIAVGIL
jgi:undecaprenyl-diphosphatase